MKAASRSRAFSGLTTTRVEVIAGVGAVVIGVDHFQDVADDLRIARDQAEAAALLDVLLACS